MKFEFKRLVDPSEKRLTSYGADGCHIVGTVTEYEQDSAGRREPNSVVYLQREVEMPKEPLDPVSVENGIRDGFLTWVEILSDPSARKIFGPQS